MLCIIEHYLTVELYLCDFLLKLEKLLTLKKWTSYTATFLTLPFLWQIYCDFKQIKSCTKFAALTRALFRVVQQEKTMENSKIHIPHKKTS